MTDEPTHDERLTLLRDCHELVEQIARRPGSAKLLTGAKAALELYASYKATRQRVRR